MKLNLSSIASRIDHTLLKPEATECMIDDLCDQAMECGFRGVCVNPIWVNRCAWRLGDSDMRVTSVVGFPLGATYHANKAHEAECCREEGADDIDMVVNLGELVTGNADKVRRDIEAVRTSIGTDAMLKVILETAALTREQIICGCKCAVEAGADFVKTSTGFHPRGGATVEAVKIMGEHASELLIKASGDIRTFYDARRMIDAGADVLGCSSGVKIIKEVTEILARRG